MIQISARISLFFFALLLISFFCTVANAEGTVVKKQQKLRLKHLTLESQVHAKEAIKPPEKKFQFFGLTITPGGFLAGEGVWRSRNEQSDIGSSFSGIPLGNSALYYMHETRFSARQSRLSLLVEGSVNPDLLLSGYYETDFLGNGSANSNESNSYDLRTRNVYAALDKKNWGFHVLAGQNWSLTTTNFNGITPRKESIPPTIDAQYVVGFVWKRQPQFRVTKNVGSMFSAALSVENPQTTFGGTACGTVLPGGITSEVCSAPGTQTLPAGTIFSINHIPDVIGKIAYEAKLYENTLHIEGFGLYRNFYDRVQHAGNLHNTNHNTAAGGIGGGIIAKVLHGMLDLQGNILSGRGIGSYASGQLPDATIAVNGSLAAIPETVFMLGATLHATPAFDIYLFGGKEKEDRKYFQVGSKFFGYGVPNANNSGCHAESGICTGNTSDLSQVTLGLWDKFYQCTYGEMRAGLQYSYTQRRLFSGNHGGALPPVGYTTNDQMVFFSLRYYPFS